MNFAIGTFFYLQLDHITESIVSPIEEKKPFLDKIITIHQSANELDLLLHKHLTGSEISFKPALKKVGEIIDDAENLKDESVLLGKDQNYLNALIAGLRRLSLGITGYQKIAKGNPSAPGRQKLYSLIDQAIIDINENLNEINYVVRRQIAKSDSSTLAGIQFIQQFLAAFFLLIVFGSLFILFIFNASLSTNLNKLILGTNKIGAGDLDWRMKSQFNDEFGKLSNAFDAMAEKLSESNQKIVEQTKKIESLAYYDTLTGLPNRLTFLARFEQELGRAKRNDERLSVLFIDLDDFKVINDVYGHYAGDRLLEMVANRLKKITRISDTVARLAGDEFTVLLPQQGFPQDASIISQRIQGEIKRPFKLSQRIIEDLSRPFELENHKVSISSSIGISLYPENGQTVQELMNCADAAMYYAKNEGKNKFRFCTEEMACAMTSLIETEKELRDALAKEEFFLEYQPQIEMASGCIVSVEALIRWRHPKKGLIAPSEFIPLAEDRGIIHDINQWVLRTVARQQEIWQTAGCRQVPVMVNISVRNFQKHDIEKSITELFDNEKPIGNLLGIEITESCMMADMEGAILALSKLKKTGITITMDDFGTGYSSLNHLKFLPLDAVKIDRSFLHDIINDPRNSVITESIVSMAHALDLKVVAEGVETDRQHEFLRRCNCDFAQGFLYFRPLPAEKIGKLLMEPTIG